MLATIAKILGLHLPPLGLTLWEAILMLIVPVAVDLPRAVFKAVALLLADCYRRVRREAPSPAYKPLVSIIVPAHNEEDTIGRCIEALLENDYPNKEIIVVDDGSTDSTYLRASGYYRRGLIKLVRREICSGKKALAVNYGVLFSRGDIIVVVDADTLLERTAIRRMVAYFSDPKIGAVSGNVRVLNRVNVLTRLQAYEYMMSMEMGRRFQSLVGTLMIIPGAFGAVRRELLRGIGIYDADTMTEDFDVTVKIHKAHLKVRFSPDAVSYTVVPDTWRGWMRQRIRWARGQLQTLIKHRNIFFRPYFGTVGLVGAPDMVFADMILLFLRMAWALALPIFYWRAMRNVVMLVLGFYLLVELILLVPAVALSPIKRDATFLLYLPLIVFLYRPLYSLVRVKAYLDGLLRAKAT